MAVALPLAGVRVLDCSRVLAGPFATMLLADLGADVVKVEPPGGDETRGWGPPWWGDPRERRSAYYASVNRNKRSIVIDLRTDAGRDLLDRFAAGSDLLIHNARPSSARRLGLDEERLRRLHPHLVVGVVRGFPGRAGAELPAYDLLAQAMSGLMAITGEPGGAPMKVGVALLDLLAGLEVVVGALAALVGRSRSAAGEGSAQHLDVALLEAGVSGLVNVLGNFLAGERVARRWGNAHPNIVPYEVFGVSDGHVAIAVGNDRQFAELLRVLGLDGDARLAGGRFATNAARVSGREVLLPILEAAIARRGRDELVAALTAADVPAGPVRDVGEAVTAMRLAAEGEWDVELGGMRLPPAPIVLDGERPPVRLPPPRLGEQTDELLVELGLRAGEIAALRRAGAVA